MYIEQLLPHIEALIFASERPLPATEIAELVAQITDELAEPEKIAACIIAITEKYDTVHYPFQLAETGGGYQFLTKKQYYSTIIKLNGDKHLKKLSAAAMETLSIIAYKQPITKSDIEFVRGVSADYSIQKLLEKELIIIAGRNEAMPGKPLLYSTSKYFMDYLGINSAHQLPKLKDITANTDVVLPVTATLALPADAAGNYA